VRRQKVREHTGWKRELNFHLSQAKNQIYENRKVKAMQEALSSYPSTTKKKKKRQFFLKKKKLVARADTKWAFEVLYNHLLKLSHFDLKLLLECNQSIRSFY
jgi:hypothetical protein